MVAVGAPLRSQAMNQRAMRRKRGHQNARVLGKILSSGETVLAKPQQLVERVGGQAFLYLLGEVADRAVDHRAAVARAGRRIDRIERLQPQDMARIDRVGIAQQVLDLA